MSTPIADTPSQALHRAVDQLISVESAPSSDIIFDLEEYTRRARDIRSLAQALLDHYDGRRQQMIARLQHIGDDI